MVHLSQALALLAMESEGELRRGIIKNGETLLGNVTQINSVFSVCDIVKLMFLFKKNIK